MITQRSLPVRAASLLTTAALLFSAAIVQAQATKPATTTTPTTRVQDKDKAKAKSKDAAKDARPATPIDLNSASTEELMTLPGVGDAISRKIVDGRPYKTADDLTKAGVPAATVAKFRPMTVVNPLPSPVDVNTATADQLQTLPGVGPALSRAIIDARPFRDYDDLAKVKGLGEAKLAHLRGRVEFGKAKAGDVAEKAETKVGAKGKAKAGEVAEKTKSKVDTAKEKAKSKLPAGKTVNINTASKEELDQLFGIGEARAQAIIGGRPYKTVEDVKNVKGIGDGIFARIKDRITVK